MVSVSLMLAACMNHPPSAPSRPSGPSAWSKDTACVFSTVSVDPDGDSVCYRFNFTWGEGRLSDWSDFCASGDTFTVSHAWSETRGYFVLAQARDAHDAESEWSDVLEIRIGTPPDTPDQPRGEGRVYVDSSYAYSSKATDPDGDSLRLLFDWGDGSTDLSGFVDSGDSVALVHTWTTEGTCHVRTRALDANGGVSAWSDTHKVEINTIEGLVKWIFQDCDRIRTAPAVGSDGTVYIGSDNDTLYALGPDGSVLWTFGADSDFRTAACIAGDGTVYCSEYDGTLFALRPEGTLLWYRRVGRDPETPAIGPDGTIYVGTDADTLFALRPDGSTIWAFHASGSIEDPPAIGPDGTVYVTDGDMFVHALSPGGATQWEYRHASRINTGTSIDPGLGLYFGCADGKLYALDFEGGVRWTFSTGGEILSQPAIAADGTLHFGSDDSRFYAVGPDGTLKWSHETRNEVTTTPLIASNGMVLFAVSGSGLFAMESDGSPAWFSVDGGSRRSPAASDSTVYVVQDNRLVGIHAFLGLADAPWPMYQHDLRHTGRVHPAARCARGADGRVYRNKD